MSAGERPEAPALARLRRGLLAILALGVVGTLAELCLLEHWEDWQKTPLVLLAAGMLALIVHALRPGRGSVRALQALSALFVAGGLVGVWLHYDGNVEFELEMYPTRAGLVLVWEAIRGATPALAPGSLSLLGLVGLLATWGHPSLGSGSRADGTIAP
jgi:hypothetical protein